MIVLGCLGREYCKAKHIDTTTHFTMMRQGCDRFQSGTATGLPSQPIDGDRSKSRPSRVRWIAVTLLFNLSCIAVFSWCALVR